MPSAAAGSPRRSAASRFSKTVTPRSSRPTSAKPIRSQNARASGFSSPTESRSVANPARSERVLERRRRLLAVAEPLARLAEEQERDVGDAGLRVVQVQVEDPDRRPADDRDERVDAAQVVPLRVRDEPRGGVGAGRAALGAREVVGRALEARLDLRPACSPAGTARTRGPSMGGSSVPGPLEVGPCARDMDV